MAPEDQKQFLERLDGDRRAFLKKLMLTAYVAPIVASFGMKGLGMGEAMAQSNSCPSNITSVPGTADLIVSQTGFPNPVNPGQNITYNIFVQNCGPAAATNVSVSDPIPTGTTFVSASQSSGPTFTMAATPPVGGTGALTFTIATFNVGAEATFLVVVNVTP